MEVITIESKAFSQLLKNIEELTDSIKTANRIKDDKKEVSPGDSNNDWLTTEETCKLLKVSKRTLQKYRDELIIPYTQLNRKIYFKRDDIQKMLESNYISLDD